MVSRPLFLNSDALESILEAQRMFFLTEEECLEVFNDYGHFYVADLALESLAKFGTPAAVYAEQKRRQVRLGVLLEALGQANIQLRSDSRLVYLHLEARDAEQWPTLKKTVSLIEEAYFLNSNTNYRYLWQLYAKPIHEEAVAMTEDQPALSMVCPFFGTCVDNAHTHTFSSSSSSLSRGKRCRLCVTSGEKMSKKTPTPSLTSQETQTESLSSS